MARFRARPHAHGKAGFTRADGTPLVTPVWITPDEDDVVFTTPGGSLKHKALLRDPRITLCIDDQEPPYSYVMITGRATLSSDLAELKKRATALGSHYMGADRAREYGARNGIPGEYLVRVTPAKVVARRRIAFWFSRFPGLGLAFSPGCVLRPLHRSLPCKSGPRSRGSPGEGEADDWQRHQAGRGAALERIAALDVGRQSMAATSASVPAMNALG